MVEWDEAMTRAKEFKRIGVDAVFVEALPDREAMRRCVQELEFLRLQIVSPPSVQSRRL